MSSLKMTFSLTSLILIFGLAFLALPAMAHDEVAAADADDTNTANVDESVAVGPHTHPTATIAVTPIADIDTTDTNANDPNMMVIDGVTYLKRSGSAFTEIPVTITFSADLTTPDTTTDNNQDGALVEADFTVNGRNPANGAPMVVGFSSATRVTDSMTTINVIFTLADGIFEAQTPAIPQAEVFISVNADAVTTPYTARTIDANGNPVGPFRPVGNLASAMATKIVVIQDDADFPTPAPTPPDAPMNLMADPGNGQVALSWDPTDDETITGYQSQHSADGGTAWTRWADITVGDDITHTVSGLTNDTEYTFAVRAVNNVGPGDAATAMATPVAPVVPPERVTGLMATAGDTQVTLSWTAPDAQAPAVASYQYSDNNGVDWMDITGSDATTTSHIVTGLTNGQTYTFIVRAVGPGTMNYGPASSAVVATSVATPPPAKPASATATVGNGKITVTWAAVTGATGYQKSVDAGTTWTAIDDMDISANADNTMLSIDVAGPNGTAISVMVRAVGAGGPGAASDAAAATPMASAVIETFSGTIPAKSYVIVVADENTVAGLPDSFPTNLTEGSSATTTEEWSAMPDLEDLFFRGGSLLLSTGNTKLNRTNDADATNDAAAAKRDVLITEIMAAVNTALVGKTGYLAHQWIEIYNNLPVPVTVKLEAKSGATLPTPGTDRVELDLVSNQKTPRWAFAGLGANGADDGIDTTADLSPFVSFFRAKRDKDGHDKASWDTSTEDYFANHKGTPGRSERSQSKPPAQTRPTYEVVINEIGNNSNDDYDWIELRGPAGKNLRNWEIWEITGPATSNKTRLVQFPDNDNHKIPANGILLIVNKDPYEEPAHPLAAGDRINGGHAEKRGITSSYYVANRAEDDLTLASGDATYLLRSKKDDKFHENIIDLTGTVFIADGGLDTQIWPLAATTKGSDNNGSGDVVNNDADNKEDDFRQGHVYKRIGGTDPAADTKQGHGKHVWSRIGYNGIGYKRSAVNSAQNGGTPGYPNDASDKANVADLADGATVTISEIMYAKGRNLPQWIELYNSSPTQSVNLGEWKLKIEHSRDADDVDIRKPSVTTNNLGGFRIQPNQTVLIVSNIVPRRGTSRASLNGLTDFPNTRVINLWGQKDKLEVDASKNANNYRLLSETAFKITLMDKSNTAVDTVGNLGANGMKLWDLPKAEGNVRSSILRRYDAGVARDGMSPAWSGMGSIRAQGLDAGSGPGTAAWVLASASPITGTRLYRGDVFYGASSDIGTPGYRTGGALPVSLSKFRPERLKETGEIVVRWITESELNNAGFNILRSDKRDGEFTKVHFRAGQGTTTERTVYEWKDTSAKPNVVYYYQIQDISLDGEVTTLRTTHLRGNVTAVGKATTTWGEIKALQ